MLSDQFSRTWPALSAFGTHLEERRGRSTGKFMLKSETPDELARRRLRSCTAWSSSARQHAPAGQHSAAQARRKAVTHTREVPLIQTEDPPTPARHRVATKHNGFGLRPWLFAPIFLQIAARLLCR